jgi:hypothetical protein
MSRIVFESDRPVAQVDPVRMDVACFVGLARLQQGATLSPAVMEWLRLQGWVTGPYERPVNQILDIPIPIENYAAFTAIFADGGPTDYLAACVRTFFAQGGKRCYVVRMGDSVDLTKETPSVDLLLPSTEDEVDDQRGWHGAGHVAGLPEVSFLAMPDLPILSASKLIVTPGATPVTPAGPVQFEECSQADLTLETAPAPPNGAPRFAPGDYTKWAATVQTVLLFLSQNFREMQLVAALPMPQETDVATAQADPANSLTQDLHEVINAVMPEPKPGGTQTGLDIGISTAFLQLAFPWLKTTSSTALLEGLEPPEGATIGLLARNALTRGTFTSAVKIQPAEIYDVSTILPGQETNVSATPLVWGDNSFKPLIQRITLFGPTPVGLSLLSDVTTYGGESYRPARIHRLVAVILRSARTLGEQIAFEQNGPRLWSRVQTVLRQLMMRLWQLNALDGDTIQDAFSVRCDASTMTQNDLDNGRLIALVTFNAASTIEVIRVTMALETSGASAQANVALQGAA